MGVFEFEKFAKGTFGVAETLAELSGKVIELLVSLTAITALAWVLVSCLLGMGHKGMTRVEAVMQGFLASPCSSMHVLALHPQSQITLVHDV